MRAIKARENFIRAAYSTA